MADTSRVIFNSNRVGARFLLTDLDLGMIFLAIADTSKDSKTVRRNLRNALTAYNSVLKLLPRLILTAVEDLAIHEKLAELRTRLAQNTGSATLTSGNLCGSFATATDVMDRSGVMDHVCEEQCECKVRLDAAIDLRTLSSARLKDVIFSGPDEAIGAALSNLRFARVRFLEARSDYREITQLTF
jgi:hypothetical protein